VYRRVERVWCVVCGQRAAAMAGDSTVDSLEAALAAMPKPEPNLVDTAFILALAGYTEQAWSCVFLCKQTYTDRRLIEPLLRVPVGRIPRPMIIHSSGSGSPDRIRFLLECGADVNATDGAGNGLIANVCLREVDRPERITRVALEHRIDTTVAGPWGPPLVVACTTGYANVVQLLLDHGVDVNDAGTHPNSRDRTPLVAACSSGHEAIAHMLIERGASLEPVINVFRAAVIGSVLSVIELLLDRDVDVNLRDAQGRTPLHWAGMQYGHTERPWHSPNRPEPIVDPVPVGRLLLSRGADVNARDNDEATPLFVAIEAARVKDGPYIRMLLASGAHTQAPIFHNLEQPLIPIERPLLFVACLNAFNMCALALPGVEASVFPGFQQRDFGPDDSSTFEISESIIRLLMVAAGTVDVRDFYGLTLLGFLCIRFNEPAVCRLLSAGADVNAVDDLGKSALHIAISNKNLRCVRLLLAAGANIHAVTRPRGRTPLFEACGYAPRCVAELLVLAGSDVNARDYKQHTPLMVACRRNDDAGEYLVSMLLLAGADVNARDHNQRTALMHCCGRGFEDKVQTLLDYGADITAQDKDGHTAWSRSADHPRIRFMLEERTANIDVPNLPRVPVQLPAPAPAPAPATAPASASVSAPVAAPAATVEEPFLVIKASRRSVLSSLAFLCAVMVLYHAIQVLHKWWLLRSVTRGGGGGGGGGITGAIELDF
jgi:ankyrin repeat protein